jgi:orotate phosphoribosyltransferase-like protein
MLQDGWWGMKGVDTIARIRREFFIRGRSIKEIARDFHVSRNTAREVLRSAATALTTSVRCSPCRSSASGGLISIACF